MKRPVIAAACLLFPLACLVGGLYGSFLFCFSVPVLWNVGIRGLPWSSLGIRRAPLWQTLGWGLGSGLVFGLAGGSILRVFRMTGYSVAAPRAIDLEFCTIQLQQEAGAQCLMMSSTPAGMGIYVLFMLGVIGLGEELFWRGFVQQKLKRLAGCRGGVLACSLLFALAHIYLYVVLPVREGSIFLGVIFLAGLSWGWLYEHTRALWPPAISHGLAALIIWKYHFFATP